MAVLNMSEDFWLLMLDHVRQEAVEPVSVETPQGGRAKSEQADGYANTLDTLQPRDVDCNEY